MYVFELPEIGEGVVEGEMVRWLVKVGDTVATDQPICEIMTDKATVEISSPRSGKVVGLNGKPGDVIKVHSPLMHLDLGGGAAAPAPEPAAATAPVATPAPTAVKPAPAAAAVLAPVALHPAVAAKMPRPPGEKALASPAVRHDAKARGLDIEAVPGSGRDGRVTRADLEAYVTPAVEPKAPPALSSPAPGQGDERVKIIGIRRKISEKMVQAWRTAPHFTYVDEVDASRLVEMRKSLLPLAESRGVRLSYLPFVMKALCVVFREFPTLNAVMDEEAFELVVRRDVNIGIATDTPAGLYVPVLKRVQEKNVLELAREITEITERTRSGKGRIDDFSGGSFTITSVGNIGGRFATPILNHPEVAILGVNQIHDRPVAVNGQVLVRPMMYLSPSFDHRVIDGAVAARFVSALKAALENPWSLVLELR
ncbi:MAG: 2-oxo acid dehydrogenase subunit E2 [Deltaproteobacteria bacterium]|nr:2-oxo acid dehydrogenase subunit E2 [Deltaproteobacteria bacterium]